MRGKYHIVVQNNRLHYELEIKRNITIIRGDSATGKTTLINMIESASELGEGSGIEVICEKKCRTLSGNDWNLVLPNLKEQIIFLDEENRFVKSQEFASEVKKSDNYFVIVTREDLPNLPYSVEEIYGIHSSGKYHDTKKIYNETYRIYGENTTVMPIKPTVVITEDSNAGHEFFKAICDENNIACKSAEGKSNIKKVLNQITEESVVVIADGAAIGPEMNELYQVTRNNPAAKLYLPESFEWIILKSSLMENKRIRDWVESPENYIDSREYFSWERFFTAKLIEVAKDTYLQYNKSSLNKNYLFEKSKNAILKEIEGIILDKNRKGGQ